MAWCNGETTTHSAEETGEPWHAECAECDATIMWTSLPSPHMKDKDYDDEKT